MCGITGIYEVHCKRDWVAVQAIGRAMNQALSQRGPDDEGSWVDPNIPLFLGHRGLSFIDLSPDGHQPMISFTGRYVITYNGEIYNFHDIAIGLEAAGVRFRGR